MNVRGFRFRLSPTNEQIRLFQNFSDICRLVYNLGLEQRRNWWRQYGRNTGQSLNYFAQCRELTSLRAEFNWVAEAPHSCQQQALRDLDRAFVDFFAGRSGHPTPRRKGDNGGFRFSGREVQTKPLNAKWSAVRLPKIGWVRFRDTRALRGVCKNATVSRDDLGWHISFACEIERDAPLNALPPVGLDMTTSTTLTLSTGEQLSLPTALDVLHRRYLSAKRCMARKMNGSKRRRKQAARCARLSAKRARIRRDWNHRTAFSISRRYSRVFVEDLKVVQNTQTVINMVQQFSDKSGQDSGWNLSVPNEGWGPFTTLLAYKLEDRGGHLIKVSFADTSQVCLESEAADDQSRESQANFVCSNCGAGKHAEVSTTINIPHRCQTGGTAPEHGVEARRGIGRQPPVETRTSLAEAPRLASQRAPARG